MDFKKILPTDSGMWGIWNPKSFSNIKNIIDWENVFLDDMNIIKYTNKGVFIPINLQTDGAFEFLVRIGKNEDLTDREKNHLVVSSKDHPLFEMLILRISNY